MEPRHDGPDGDLEALGGLAIFEAVETTQHEGIALRLGELLDHLEEGIVAVSKTFRAI